MYEGRIGSRHSFPGSDVDLLSLAITFLFFAFLVLFILKWIAREEE